MPSKKLTIPGSVSGNIDLPAGAAPGQIVIDDNDEYAYVTDSVSPSIYVIDVDEDSSTYNQCVRTITIDAPNGLRGLALNADGTRLFVAALNKEHPVIFSNYSGGSSYEPHIDATPSHVLVIDTSSPDSKTQWPAVDSIPTGQGTYTVTATSDPGTMVFSNYLPDPNSNEGLGVISGTTAHTVTSFSLPADIQNIRAVAITPDGKYAFVSAWDLADIGGNVHPFHDSPNGSKIGIIDMQTHTVVGRTRSFPFPSRIWLFPMMATISTLRRLAAGLYRVAFLCSVSPPWSRHLTTPVIRAFCKGAALMISCLGKLSVPAETSTAFTMSKSTFTRPMPSSRRGTLGSRHMNTAHSIFTIRLKRRFFTGGAPRGMAQCRRHLQ